jgi:hypothetical protein
MRKILLGLALVASLAFAPAASASIDISPNATPTYSGGDGTGTWTSSITITESAPQVPYQVEVYFYLWADGYLYGSSNNAFYLNDRTVVGSLNSSGNPTMANTPSNCPYPGFHWFGEQVLYRYRQFDTVHNVWFAWINWKWSAVGPGVYGQACL